MMRTVVRGLTATILAISVAIALTIEWTGPAFWLALPAALAVGLLMFVIRWVRGRRELPAAIVRIHTVNDCDRAGHAYRKVPKPTVWRCVNCGDRVESTAGWVGSDAS